MSKNNTKKEVIENIKQLESFAILISDPDEDAVGSGLATASILDKLNKTSNLYSSYKVSDIFGHLKDIDRYIHRNIVNLNLSKYDAIIFLDSSTPSRVLDKSKQKSSLKIPENVIVFNIDHHEQKKLFGDINYVKPKACATAAVLWELFNDEVEIDKQIANYLLNGIIGDTQCFKVLTDSEVLRLGAKLVDKGADYEKIAKYASGYFDLEIVKMNIDAIKSIVFDNAGKYKFAYTVLNPEKFGFKQLNRIHRKLVQYNVLNVIKGIDFTLMIVPLERLNKLSFRSKTLNVRKIASEFGGGGHDRSAGAVTELSVNEIIEKIQNIVNKKVLKLN